MQSEIISANILEYLGYDLDTHIVRGNEMYIALRQSADWADFLFNHVAHNKSEKLNIKDIDEPSGQGQFIAYK